jgi:putative ABC transport system substrate-binding protein
LIGFVEGQNVIIEYRWANGEARRLPTLAEELVQMPVAVLATGGGDQTAQAAKVATAMIPIVSDFGDNPVEMGMVASLNRPGGNVTGVNQMIAELVTKQLGLLHELVPQAPVLAVLVNPANPRRAETITTGAPAAARAIGCDLQVFKAVIDQDIDTAFITAAGTVARTDGAQIFLHACQLGCEGSCPSVSMTNPTGARYEIAVDSTLRTS